MGDPLIEAYIELKADMSNVDAVLDKLPKSVAKSVSAGAAAMKPLQEAVNKQEVALKAYIATLTGLTPKQIKANDTVQEMQSKLEGLQGQLGRVRGAIDAKLVGGLDAAGKGANSAGYKMLQFGNIMDDLQYVPQQGLRPNINNIMQLSPIIGVAMIAVDGLVKAFGGWEAILKPGHTKTEAERMEELAKATEHVADAQSKLTKMKRDEAAGESQRGSQTKLQKAQAEAVGEAIAEGPVDAIVHALVQDPDALARTDAEANVAREARDKTRAGLKAHRSLLSGAPTDAEVDAEPLMKAKEDAYRDALDKAARRLMAQAQNDPGKLAELIAKVKANPGAFPTGFADNLGKATPEAIKKAKSDAESEVIDKANREEEDSIQKAQQDAREDDQKRAGSEAKQAAQDQLDAARERLKGAGEVVQNRRAELAKMVAPQMRSVDAMLTNIQSGAFSKTEDKILAEAIEQKKLLEKVVENTAKKFKATYK